METPRECGLCPLLRVSWVFRLQTFLSHKEPDRAQGAQHQIELPASHPAPGATQTLASPPHPAHPGKL